MSAPSAPGRRLFALMTALLALGLFAACEKVEDDPELALEIQTGSFPGLGRGNEFELHAGVEESSSQTWTATTDEDGALSFGIEVDNEPHPRDFLWITADLIAPNQSSLNFTVLVGEYADLRDAADADGVVSPAEFGRVRVSPLRAVETVMLNRANDGEPIRTTDTLRQRIDEIDGTQLLDSATAFYIAINTQNPGFPDELTSTSVIVDDEEMVTDLILQAGEVRPDILGDARAAALRDTDARTGWDTAADLGDRWGLFQPNYPGLTGEVLNFDSETAGRLGAPEGQDSFTWTFDNGVAQLDFAGDVTWEDSEERENEDGETVTVQFTESYESAEIHRIAAGQSSDLVLFQVRFRRVFDDEDLGTEIRETNEGFTAWRDSLDSVPAGVEGVWSLNLPRDSDIDRAARVSLEANGMGEVLSGGWQDGETINWQASNGELLLEHPDGRLIIRFLRETEIGWFVTVTEEDDTGSVVGESVDIAGFGDQAFDPNDVAGRYEPYGGPSEPGASPQTFQFQLQDDGSGMEGRTGDVRENAWTLENGNLVIRSCLDPEEEEWVGIDREPESDDECDGYRRREWDLVTVEPSDFDGTFMVVEHFQQWNENSLDESPDVDEYRQLFFLERRALNDSEASGSPRQRLRDVHVPGRGHPDPEISG